MSLPPEMLFVASISAIAAVSFGGLSVRQGVKLVQYSVTSFEKGLRRTYDAVTREGLPRDMLDKLLDLEGDDNGHT
jgi:hypothetical protein